MDFATFDSRRIFVNCVKEDQRVKGQAWVLGQPCRMENIGKKHLDRSFLWNFMDFHSLLVRLLEGK